MPYGLDWGNERYVRLYTRDTPAWNLLGWEGQAVYMALKRKLDRAGTLGCAGVSPVEAIVAALPGWDAAVVEAGATRLLERDWLIYNEDLDVLVDPDHLPAEEASQSNAQRCRESRYRRAEISAASQRGLFDFVPTATHSESSATQNASEPTQDDTPTRADPDRAGQSSDTSDPLLRGFEEWWAVELRGVGKAACKAVWRQKAKKKVLPPHDQVIAAYQAQARALRWTGDQFTPHGRTWLNQERWGDQLPARRSESGRRVDAAAPTPDRERRRARRKRNVG